MNRTYELKSGICSFPKQMYELLNITEDSAEYSLIKDFWDNVWHNYLQEKSVDTLLWFNRFPDSNIFNKLLMHLSKSGWITSDVDLNYATIKLNTTKLNKWITNEEISNIRYNYKFNKYRLEYTKSTIKDIVQVNDSRKITGLIREGFMKAGNNTFTYDTKYISKYIEGIAWNIEKGLTGSTRDITYQEICDELINYYSINTSNYTLGNNISDSRGRSIFRCTSKIFNPVSNKEARACIILPEFIAKTNLSVYAMNCIFAAITELLGYKAKTYEEKILMGQNAYIIRDNFNYEEMQDKKDYTNLHNLIWLERIYENLDNIDNGWYVPIELDATASMIQIVAVLTNDHEYMNQTNIIGDTLQDIWSRPYCSRTHIKKAMVPILYGSSAHPTELWTKAKLNYNQEQINAISLDLLTGIYANARKFKDFIINNVNPQVKQHVNIWNDSFDVYCNRYKWEGTTEVNYFVYTSPQNLLKKVVRSVNRIPDTEQFKRYFVTCLIHNLDSQIANNICKSINWVLPNHDAFLVSPVDAYDLQQVYLNNLYTIYKKRKTILNNYFHSINIESEYPEQNDSEILFEEFKPTCLK